MVGLVCLASRPLIFSEPSGWTSSLTLITKMADSLIVFDEKKRITPAEPKITPSSIN
jgi:hypothetical protein